MPLSINSVGAILADAEPGTPAGYFIVQTRDLIQKRALSVPRAGHGRTAALAFSAGDVAKLRLLGVLQRIGLAPDAVVAAGQHLDNVEPGDLPSRRGKPDLDIVLDRIRAGEQWFFHLHVLRAPQPAAGAFSRSADGQPPRPLKNLTLATVTLDATELLKLVLAAADAAEG